MRGEEKAEEGEGKRERKEGRGGRNVGEGGEGEETKVKEEGNWVRGREKDGRND